MSLADWVPADEALSELVDVSLCLDFLDFEVSLVFVSALVP